MVAALFLLIGFSDWTPARWPSADPKSLELLSGAAVNTVLLEPQQWDPAFLKAAAARDIVTVGVIHPGGGAIALARRAAGLKLNAIVLEGDFDPSVRAGVADAQVTVIEMPSRGRIPLDTRDPIVGTSQALWPGIEIEHGGSVSMGPTSAPWINTNSGFLRFLTAATKATVWLGERPPPRTAVPVERYAIAVADAAICGARWIVALDDDLERRLFAGQPGAIEQWKRINAYIRYFDEKREWRDWRPFSEFAVLEDASSGGLLSSGLLDMLAVQHTAARALPTHEVDTEALRGTRIILNVDKESLRAGQWRDLQQFTDNGGKLVDPPSGWRFPATAPDQMVPTRQQMNQIQPIWEVTYNSTVRKNFGARTFNTSTIIFALRASPDGKSMLLHLLNYADYVSEDVAVQVLGTWHHARLYEPGKPPRDLPVYPVKDGTGVDIDRIAIFATLVVD